MPMKVGALQCMKEQHGKERALVALRRRLNTPYMLGHWKKRTAALAKVKALQKAIS